MNYLLQYQKLLDKHGVHRLPEKGYFERHHILPKCVGGDSTVDNLIYLSLRCHYLAHYLLYKAFPEHKCLAYAFMLISGRNQKINSKVFAEIREKISGKNHEKSVKVHTPLGWFNSVREAAKAHNISHPIISKKCKSKKFFHSEYYYETNFEDKFENTDRAKHLGKKVVTPDGVFNSVREAGAFYKVYHSTISKWCKSKPDFYYLEEAICNKKAKRKVHTPLGWFDSVSMAAKAENTFPGTISSRCKNSNFSDYYYSEQD